MKSTDFRETAADLAADAAFLQMAENLGLSALLDGRSPFTLREAAAAAALPEDGAGAFLRALVSAGLLEQSETGGRFVPCADMADRRYQAGYLSWSLNANRPYIDHAAEIVREPAAAVGYPRDGRQVAVSSRWIGSAGFYPDVIARITERKPRRVVDLGAGAGALLIRLLTELPDSTGVALDLSAGACEEAERAAERAGVRDRLEVAHRSIESLVDDATPVRDADVVHAGFVMHDVVSKPEVLDRLLRTVRSSLAPGGCFVVTDAVPFTPGARERGFSALFSYLHASSMDVKLPSEQQWRDGFARAGFSEVTCTPLRMPGSRAFVAVG
ncbi:class I SAM-dependent methyltransferase [Streptomyces sp. NPDC091287]|uniref:class I SAM-dependent methyltransferase n=1 Tax=Streptomyces sp. NPDC091287 TaxID=3365988 RepID=UPI00380DF706